MKSIIVALGVILGACAIASGQTFHVISVRKWAANDPAPASHVFRVYVVSGTMDGKQYDTQQMFSWGSQHFQVGQNYAITKVSVNAINVIMHDKKGREVKDRLDVTSVEEAH